MKELDRRHISTKMDLDKRCQEEHQHPETPYEPLIPTGGAFQDLQHKLQATMAGLLPILFSNRS